MTLDNIISSFRSVCNIQRFIPTPSFAPSLQTGLFWTATIVSIIILVAIMAAAVAHIIHGAGFYGKNLFQTKHDIRRFTATDGVVSDKRPEWTRFCDVAQTTIVNGDSMTERSVTNVNKLLARSHDEESSFNPRLVTTREVSYVAIHMRDDKPGSPVDYAICATPATLKLPTGEKCKGHNKKKAIPIYVFECIPDDKNTYTSSGFHSCLATLVYFQQSNTPLASVSLLRTNGPIWNLVPLSVYDENTYRIDKTLDYKFNAEKRLRFFMAKADTVRSVVDYVDRFRGDFDVVITKELSDVISLIESKVIVIVGCTLNGSIIGSLFFIRRPSSMELCGSVFSGVEGNVKRACFSRAVILANRVFKSSSIRVPGVSHNKYVIDMIGVKPTVVVKRACYLRNYRTTVTYEPTKCLILV